MNQRVSKPCDECGANYFADASAMDQLCPECAHRLYGYPSCAHEMIAGCCSRCGWDGSSSQYLHRLAQSDLQALVARARGFTWQGLLSETFTPAALELWQSVARLDREPELTVTPGDVHALDRAFRAQAENAGVVDADGQTLLSVGGLGGQPWAVVRVAPDYEVHELATIPGHPECLLRHPTHDRWCAVTCEEHSWWILSSAPIPVDHR